jgi:hypothetical protein
MGEKGILPPKAGDAADQRRFYTEIGVPKDVAGYADAIKRPEKIGERAVPEKMWNQGRADAFAKMAYDNGLTPAQVSAVRDFDLNGALDAMASFQTQNQEARATSEAALKKEWGDSYTDNLKGIYAVAEKWGGKEMIDHPGLGNDPVFLRFMHKVAAAVGEKPGIGTRQQAGRDGTSPAEALEKARAIGKDYASKMKADRNFPNSPEGRKMQQEKTALFQIAYPNGQ